ncbi:hypothetical protein, partial [Kosmotoga pacifica]|uniref:hypothetical protein n=1 Tax=Kosmotoga pacifica TaxID=1330330 RepID=UPI0025869FFB
PTAGAMEREAISRMPPEAEGTTRTHSRVTSGTHQHVAISAAEAVFDKTIRTGNGRYELL